jgi:hypothetical protein
LLCSQRYHGKKAFPIEMRNAVDVDIWLGGWTQGSEWSAVHARLKSEDGAAPRTWQSLKRIMKSTTKVIEDKKKIQTMAICLIKGDTRRLRLYPEQAEDEEEKEDDAESSEADSKVGFYPCDIWPDIGAFGGNKLYRQDLERMLAEHLACGGKEIDSEAQLMLDKLEELHDLEEMAAEEEDDEGEEEQGAVGGGAAAAPKKKRKKNKKKQEGKGKQRKGKQRKGQPPPVKK